MKKVNLIAFVILAISLTANIFLIINYSNSMKKSDQYEKKLATTKKNAQRAIYALSNAHALGNVEVKSPDSYKYDRSESDGNVMTEDEANAIYFKNQSKYENIGIDGLRAPNPFGDKNINRAKVTDEIAQKYLLRLIDNPKERTRQRVEWLSYAVFLDKSRLKHRKVYTSILKKWRESYDFSQIQQERKVIENL
ncbi:hypothetical protein [Sporolactobacillus nakayamae]|uniref:Uncharacterized protein n=1 Tax=Sporolactobacillus nakayamae TaxID=269670 RepID=A0A1I2QKT2_9BACL|nr:hypothetical protein [Sporolactobacillus nakayamae]SFG29215.1 hypothetical protein SAMN02982927_01279 [Sporolactobacillus nakayamae]